MPIYQAFRLVSSISLWASGQPDNWPAQPGQPEEDCLCYAFGLDGQRWSWNDLDCNSEINYICSPREDEGIL